MNVFLNPEIEQFIQTKIESGKYAIYARHELALQDLIIAANYNTLLSLLLGTFLLSEGFESGLEPYRFHVQ